MRYVALLRGINVGGNHKVPMGKLKNVFEQLGCTNVSTYINSGNVIFEGKSVAPAKVEAMLHKVFGFSIPVVMRDTSIIQKLATKIPKTWQNNAEHRTEILFLWEKFDSKKTLSLIKTTPVDTLLYIPGAIVWHIKRKDYAKSGLHKLIGTEVYKHMTARNVNTVRKLSELMSV